MAYSSTRHGLKSKQQGQVGDPHGTSHGEEDEEGDHQTEEPHGLRQGKAQNSIGEELLLERWVSGIAKEKELPNTIPKPLNQ